MNPTITKLTFWLMMATTMALNPFGKHTAAQHAPQADYLRQRFDSALVNEKHARSLYQELQNLRAADSALLLAYRCAAVCAIARHSSNPFGMASQLYQAKQWIEKAIELKPNNYEIRFLRFAIESSVPSWLAIGTHLKQDVAVIEKTLRQHKPPYAEYTKRVCRFLLKKANLTTAQHKLFAHIA